MSLTKRNYILLFLSLITIFIGIFFRFYNIPWGSPLFFHPDERNIASSISQLTYPQQMNPHFFAYGSLPIYSIYFAGVAINFIQNILFHAHNEIMRVGFENAIVIGRTFSVFFSVLLLYLIYIVGKEVGGKKGGLISTMLASSSIGFIQYAHFSTFEIWLSFFLLFLCYLIYKYLLTGQHKYFIASPIVLGFLISIKISSLVYLPLCLLILILVDVLEIIKANKKTILLHERALLKMVVFAGICLISTYLTSPYFWIDNPGFWNSMHYESSVAIGSLPVFYTQEFEKTIPIIYQLTNVYPFILNPFIEILALISIFFVSKEIIVKKNRMLFIIIIFFIITLLSQLFLFVKWIRYYIPTISFIYIFLGYYLTKLLTKPGLLKKRLALVVVSFFILISVLYSFAYFKTALWNPDTRVGASSWAGKNISHNSRILSEVYDLGIVPFNSSFGNIKLFNFYDLDVSREKVNELHDEIADTQYIILPSPRILQSRILKPNLFPQGNLFYKNLVSEKSGFKKIYKTPCDIFCNILYLGNPIYSYEQTASVFDRPTITIFKKIK